MKKKKISESFKYINSLNPRKDISHQRINNKLKNVNFGLKYRVFVNLMKHINAVTDNSFAYIPIKYYETPIMNSQGKLSYTMSFLAPSEENNYADLIVNHYFKNIGFKFVRTKSLESIELDGSHVTWNPSAMNDNNYLVFYSTNPNEMGRIIIITTKIYETLVMNKARILNYNKIHEIKNKLMLTDKQLKLINYEDEFNLSENHLININLKHQACMETLNEINKNQLFYMKKKTHYGNKYIAYNINDGRKIIFRDCISRNNFFNFYTDLKLANNRSISRNIKNQDSVVNGDELKKYQMNIFENEGWIITKYIPNDEEFKSYVQTLLHSLVILSSHWKRRLKKLLKKIDEVITCMTDKLTAIKNKLKDKICYFRPLNLLNYITCTDNTNMNKYFEINPFMKRFYYSKC